MTTSGTGHIADLRLYRDKFFVDIDENCLTGYKDENQQN